MSLNENSDCTEENQQLNSRRSSTDPDSNLYPDIASSFLLSDGTPDYIRLILTSKVYDIIEETPLTPATNLSSRLGAQVLLKREDLQPVFSFKIRGAYNKIAHLPKEDCWKGIIACSAGNHAQGVAYSAQRLKIPSTIVMPVVTPSIKHLNVTRMGSKVVLYGDDFDQAKEECLRLSLKHGLTDIPPYDDPYVIAGQGTIAMEILRQCNLDKLEIVFCCVGGGGLIAGVATYLKRIAPHIKIIGVETFDADAMTRSLEEREITRLNEVGLFADGAAVRVVGTETFRLCSKYVDEMVLVSTDEICAAIKDVFEDTRSIVEPAGALSVAGLKKYLTLNPPTSQTSYCAILSGANMNFDRLRFVAERAEIGEQREVLMSVVIPETPGTFVRLTSVIYPRAVTEFSYRYSDKARAVVLIGFQITNWEDIEKVRREFGKEGFVATDISGDEMVKDHIRYLSGGKAQVDNERLFRFEFPERPGALSKFLAGLKTDWNISLFHYRNHGSDVGKVLVAIQVPAVDNTTFDDFLRKLGFPHIEETSNKVYSLFLKSGR
ncbi:Threonine dehydratase, mitochondrial [Neolecta irregularis DAH-3]|uniref:Threonine dehydratase n=1 Tax=Neolecta irregularis (strain DAH-3) TaxID=1198029 RepID=A0A1U7LP37_NEOID|nr:Threonine dehydratase, mitochondrial [Neolecta irregularis DAH-3]|eukprot:OLL24353.1 Threonine dehydratase, mitochondrial [Neolecta irregularis DAH-3]